MIVIGILQMFVPVLWRGGPLKGKVTLSCVVSGGNEKGMPICFPRLGPWFNLVITHTTLWTGNGKYGS